MIFNQNQKNIAVTLPISSRNRETARNFADEQATEQKGEQVLYNTLAVLAVQSYLQMLGITTDLLGSDSWNPVMRACGNVADLAILDLGKLECRPVRKSDTSCYMPMEVWDLRLGYVAVEIDDSLKKASLLGFAVQVSTENLTISDLRPIEALIDRLHDVKALTARDSIVDLEQWLNNLFTAGWLTVESLLNSEQFATAWEFRSPELSEDNPLKVGNNSIQRAKLIDLGIQFGDRQIVLLVEITPEDNDSIAVVLQLHPNRDNIYLPEMLKLKVIESSGAVFMQAQARSQDNFIQLQFSGQPKESFSVQIVLDNAEFTEQFRL